MVQSEIGDLYKVTLQLDENDNKIVNDLIITVFDSIQCSNNICITKTGLLFTASEFGNHSLYQFQSIGDDDSAIRSSRIQDEELNESLGDDSLSAAQVASVFIASGKLKNLLLIDELASLAPVTDMLVEDIVGEGTPQIVTLCGRGYRSSLRVLRHGVSVSELAVSDLPGRAQAVWTVKGAQTEAYDRFIVVSLHNTTLVLSVGDTVEEITDSGFLGTTSTLQVVLLEDNALLQVHPKGIRHIRQDKRVSEWKAPGGKTIEKSAVNSRQVVISLAGGEIIYFELDMTGQLMEMGSQELGKEVSSLDMGIVPVGRMRSSFLAVGCWDDSVQVLSLDPSDLLVQRSVINLSARADSLCLIQLHTEQSTKLTATPSAPRAVSSGDASLPTLYLNVGLSTGVLIRVAVDPLTGALTDSRQRFLGPRSVKLFRVPFNSQPGVVALTTRPWAMYSSQGRFVQAPVTYETLDYVHPFCSEQCPEGIVAVSGSTLRIITIENLGDQFNSTVTPLRYTPRKMCQLPQTKQLVLIEADHNEYSEAERNALSLTLAGKAMSIEDGNGHPQPTEQDAEEEEEATILPLRGPVPPADGKWASCIRVLEPATSTTLDLVELSSNEAAFSICTCKFVKSPETFVAVGIARDLVPMLRKTSGCHIKLYRVIEGRLQFVHQTDIDDIPQVMIEFQGKLLVGAGRSLRLYEMGKKKLLLKCENKLFPVGITRLLCSGDRVYVGDMVESIHFVKYRRLENTLSIFADDTYPRFEPATLFYAIIHVICLTYRATVVYMYVYI